MIKPVSKSQTNICNPSFNIDSLTNLFLHLKHLEANQTTIFKKCITNQFQTKFHEPNFKSEFISCKRAHWNV